MLYTLCELAKSCGSGYEINQKSLFATSMVQRGGCLSGFSTTGHKVEHHGRLPTKLCRQLVNVTFSVLVYKVHRNVVDKSIAQQVHDLSVKRC